MTASIVLTHQDPASVLVMREYWQALFPDIHLVIAYGGEEQDYRELDFSEKFYIADAGLRTKDHQREHQSYTAVFEGAADYMNGKPCDYVYFTEFDHIPLRMDFMDLILGVLERESADVIMRNLQRVDGTGHPHQLYHLETGGLTNKMGGVSLRKDPSVVLSGFGFGQLWKWNAFRDTAAVRQDVPVYLELWLPTVAHHLGYRVRGWDHSAAYHGLTGDRISEVMAAIQQRAWAIHPVKSLWRNPETVGAVLQEVQRPIVD